MLKRKQELNYLRGYTHSSCGDCNSFVPNCQLTGIDGQDLGSQPRCREIGLEPGRMYRVSPNNICDLYDNSKYLARLIGARSNG